MRRLSLVVLGDLCLSNALCRCYWDIVWPTSNSISRSKVLFQWELYSSACNLRYTWCDVYLSNNGPLFIGIQTDQTAVLRDICEKPALTCHGYNYRDAANSLDKWCIAMQENRGEEFFLLHHHLNMDLRHGWRTISIGRTAILHARIINLYYSLYLAPWPIRVRSAITKIVTWTYISSNAVMDTPAIVS